MNFNLKITDASWTSVKREKRFDGIRYTFSFSNNYGASVIKNSGSYGADQDLWELAVLKHGELCYDTVITSDVEGWLSDEEVNSFLSKIGNL